MGTGSSREGQDLCSGLPNNTASACCSSPSCLARLAIHDACDACSMPRLSTLSSAAPECNAFAVVNASNTHIQRMIENEGTNVVDHIF
jgi:hypothetical protein